MDCIDEDSKVARARVCRSPVFIRLLDHQLRSYDGFGCWLVVSSLCMCKSQKTKLTTYFIDLKSLDTSSLGLAGLLTDPDTLKVVTSES
jgi:hypothetical protein